MEETQELKSETIDRPVPESQEVETPRSQVIEIPRFLFDATLRLEELAVVVLEWSIDLLGFERGFVLRESDANARDPKDSPDSHHEETFVVLASRQKRDDDSRPQWNDVRNPEFALNRSVALRALAATESVAVNDCLIQPESGGQEQNRTVLARSFSLASGTRAAIYLDRGLGMRSIEETEREKLDTFVEGCAPALARAFLAEEVDRLRETLTKYEETESVSDSDDESAGEAELATGSPVGDGSFPSFYGIVGQDEKLQKIFHVVNKVKDSNLNICIFGESGTGKELVARAVHDASERRDKPFISENCGAIAENLLESELFGHVKGAFTGAEEDKQGFFELADEGMLFLDEIGDMSEGMQRKLLRVLQEGTIRPIGGKKSLNVDVRVICASNRDLKNLVREGSFRADLYYRLNVIQVHVPPLRERRGDIRLLIDYFTVLFLKEEGLKKRFSDSAIKALCQYSWPGNVREVRNVIRRALLTCPRRVVARKEVLTYLQNSQATACLGENLERDDDQLVLRIPLRQHFNDIVDECERLVLLNALKENGWNKSRVTKALGIPRQSLYNKIAKYDLQKTWAGDEQSAE